MESHRLLKGGMRYGEEIATVFAMHGRDKGR